MTVVCVVVCRGDVAQGAAAAVGREKCRHLPGGGVECEDVQANVGLVPAKVLLLRGKVLTLAHWQQIGGRDKLQLLHQLAEGEGQRYHAEVTVQEDGAHRVLERLLENCL